MYPEKTIIRKDTCTPVFIATLLTIGWTGKQTKCPSSEAWIKKMWCIYTMEYNSAIKKNAIIPFTATWMNLEIVILNEVSWKRQISYDITYMWNQKNMQINLFTKIEIDTVFKNKLIVTKLINWGRDKLGKWD